MNMKWYKTIHSSYWGERWTLTKSTSSNAIFISIYANVFPSSFSWALDMKIYRFWKIPSKLSRIGVRSKNNCIWYGSQCDWIAESDEFHPCLNLYICWSTLGDECWLGGFFVCVYSSNAFAVCIYFILIFPSRGRRRILFISFSLVLLAFCASTKETNTPLQAGHWVHI